METLNELREDFFQREQQVEDSEVEAYLSCSEIARKSL